MFNIDEKPEFTHTVKVPVPCDGGFREDEFKARFRALTEEELKAFDNASVEGHKDLLRAVVIDLLDVENEQNKVMTFSSALLENMLGRSNVRLAMLRTYTEAVVGVRRGN